MQRQLHRLGYENVLPRGTPMLKNEQKERRVQWAFPSQLSLGGIARKPRPVTAKACSIDLTDLAHILTVDSPDKFRKKLKISARSDDPF